MPDESLLTDEVLALVGREWPMLPVQVTLRGVRHAMDVYAPGSIADFVAGDDLPGYALAALDSESEPPPLPHLLPDSLLISNEWQFERPLRLEETLSVTYRLASVTERFGGRFGYSIDFRSEVDFLDGDGTLVARSSRTMMAYDARNAAGDSG